MQFRTFDNRVLLGNCFLALAVATLLWWAVDCLRDPIPEMNELVPAHVTLAKVPRVIDRRRWKDIRFDPNMAQLEFSPGDPIVEAAVEDLRSLGDRTVVERISRLVPGESVDLLVQRTERAEFGGHRIWQISRSGVAILSYVELADARRASERRAAANLLFLFAAGLALLQWARMRPIDARTRSPGPISQTKPD